MVAKVAYEVVSEFVFDQALALASTNALTKSIEGLSKKTDDAIFGVARLGVAYAKQFVTGGAGILGILGSAIKSSEKFRTTQIELANTMISNRMTDAAGNTLQFAGAMEVAEGVLKRVSKEAKKANLMTGDLANSTKFFATVLGSKKDFEGDVFGSSIELARVSSKAGAALGLDPNNMSGQILNALGGHLSNNTLFGQRLFAESGDVLEKGGAKDIKSFNAMKVTKRVQLLTKAMDKLAGGYDVINARSKSLSQRFRALSDIFFGIDSVLKPLGDTLMKIIGPIMDEIIKQVSSKGKILGELFNKVFKTMGDSPEQLLLNISQFTSLHSDIKKTGKALMRLGFAIAFVGLTAQIGVIKTFITRLIMARGFIGAVALQFAKLSRVFQGLLGRGILARIGLAIPSFMAILFIFQILSRAAMKMKIEFFKLVDIFANRFLKQIDRLLSIISLITEPFSFVVEIFSDLLSTSILMKPAFEFVLGAFKSLNNVLEFFAVTLQGVFIFLKSMGAFIGALFGTLAAGIQNPSLFMNKDYLKSIATSGPEAFTQEMDSGIKGVVDRLLNPKTGEKTVAKTNMTANVSNTFNIKEKIEPDRIAFTLTDQLKKLSENRRSSVGRPLQSAGGSI